MILIQTTFLSLAGRFNPDIIHNSPSSYNLLIIYKDPFKCSHFPVTDLSLSPSPSVPSTPIEVEYVHSYYSTHSKPESETYFTNALYNLFYYRK